VLDEDGKTEREIFAQLGKAGDIIAADLEAICRVASLSLRHGVSLEKVIDQLKDIGSTHVLPSAYGKIVSMPDALAKALQKYLNSNISRNNVTATEKAVSKGKEKSNGKERTESNYGIKCPACKGGTLSFQEGCQKCYGCGYSAC
jgi:ribonucleoside-diphosphate reductase alpha chain